MKKILFFVVSLLFLVLTGNASNRMKEALVEIFPKGHTEQIVIINDQQCLAIENTAKALLASRIITIYATLDSSSSDAFAILANATVRTHPVLFLGIFDKEGKISGVEIIAFLEPLDYLPTRSWLEILSGTDKSADLFPGASMPNITGATLTARTIAKELRVMLEIMKIQLTKGQL